MADLLDFPIPTDPAFAEFAYIILKQLRLQNELNCVVNNMMKKLDKDIQLLKSQSEA